MTSMTSRRKCFHLHYDLRAICVITICVTLTLGIDLETKSEEDRTLHCRVRDYTYTVTKPPYYSLDGRLLECYGEVTVTSCWGRCDSSEIADYRIPYKESYHPVCMYDGRERWMAELRYCHPQYPTPLAEVFNATGCMCRKCPAHDTSCETLHT